MANNSLVSAGQSKASWAIIFASVLTLILYLVPFLSPLAYPFVLLSTLVHEMGHGVAAVMVGGKFVSYKMWFNGSGVAITAGDFGRFSRAFIAAAGLVGPAVMAGISFWFIKSSRSSRIFLATFGLINALAILLVVRNAFGIFFVAGICGLCYLFSYGSLKSHAQVMLAFFAAQLSLSVFSRSDYLFTDTAQTGAGTMPSDVAQIAQALFLPYWFWGALCGLFSLSVLAFGVKRLLNTK